MEHHDLEAGRQEVEEEQELNEEEARLRAEWEEKEARRIALGLWPSTEWETYYAAHRRGQQEIEEEQELIEEEARLRAEWEEKEARRIALGLWPSTEWETYYAAHRRDAVNNVSDEERGAVGGLMENDNDNDNVATIEVTTEEYNYMQAIPSSPPPPAKNLRRRPSSLPRSGRVEISADRTYVNYALDRTRSQSALDLVRVKKKPFDP